MGDDVGDLVGQLVLEVVDVGHLLVDACERLFHPVVGLLRPRPAGGGAVGRGADRTGALAAPEDGAEHTAADAHGFVTARGGRLLLELLGPLTIGGDALVDAVDLELQLLADLVGVPVGAGVGGGIAAGREVGLALAGAAVELHRLVAVDRRVA